MSSSSDAQFEEFIALFIRYQSRLVRYVLVLLPHANDAEDIVQETAITMWRRFRDYTPGTNFYAWGCRTAYLKVLEHQRHNSRRQAILDPDVLEHLAVEALDKNQVSDARTAALERCLKKLRPRDRELIERRYMRGEKGQHIASKLGRPANSVYQSLGRIRRTLLECITRNMTAAGPEGGRA